MKSSFYLGQWFPSVWRNLRCHGFSLVEIVLALGVIAFALVAIMGMFPVAMRAARDSQSETRATHIAQQIFNDLQSTDATNTFIAIGTNILNAGDRLAVNLTNSGSYSVSYDIAGLPLGIGTNAQAIYMADIAISAHTPTNGLARVQATISIPPAAVSSNRSKFIFVTVLHDF